MARISDEDIQRVRAATDLAQIAAEHVQLKRSGRKFKACCPFHQEKTPSFQIDPELGLWHCFGCGEGGDVFDFVMRMDNLDFPDAVRYLAERAHIELSEEEGGRTRPRGFKERLLSCMQESAGFYHRNLMRSSSVDAGKARSYLKNRGLSGDICNRWNIGYAPGRGALVAHLSKAGYTSEEMIAANVALSDDSGRLRDRFFERIMFPIQDRAGKTIAFGGRVIGKGEPKYLNTGDTPLFSKSRNLYGIEKAKNSITSEACAIIVEGYTDTIALHEAGITNAVATLGTALTPQHLRMLRSLRPKRIIYLFDGDSAGQKAADRASAFIDGGITPESGGDYTAFDVVVLPGDEDPAEFVAEKGREGMDEQLASAVPLIRFAIDRRLREWDLTDTGQRNQALLSAVSLLAPIKESIVAADYTNYIADRLGCPVEIAMTALRQSRQVHTDAPANAPMSAQNAPLPRRRTVETEQERIARECLSLVASRPSLCSFLRSEARSGMRWPDKMSGSVAAAFSQSGMETNSPADAVQEVERQVEGATAYLSAGTIECDSPEQAAAMVKTLLSQVKENDLLARIRSGNSRLKMSGSMSEQEYDDLFRDVSALQKELNRLRNERR